MKRNEQIFKYKARLQTLSELQKLETRHAPCMTKTQCENRCVALQASIDAGWEFIVFMNKLDPAMRVALFNYIYTQATLSEEQEDHSDFNEDINPELDLLTNTPSDSDNRTNKRNTKSLSPKKRSQKISRKTKNKSPSPS